MNVLHICEYVRGGITTYLDEIVRYQASSPEVGTVSVLMSRFNSDKLAVKGIPIYYYHYRRNPLFFIPAMVQISHAIQRIQPDIIHVHSSFAGMFVRSCFLFKKRRPKIVYCAHGWSFLMETSELKKYFYGMLERLLARETDVIINISHKEFMGSKKYRLPKDKSLVIPNGVEAHAAQIMPAIDLKLNQDYLNLLFVGRFDRQKGLDILIDYFIHHPKSQARLYVIGDHVLTSMSMHIPKQIVWLGWVDHYLIDSYYACFDAVIIPSRWEGFGMVAVEAMKNKKAVIASNRGALPELVHDGINGYIFNLNYLHELTVILQMIDKQQLKEMGERGYQIYQHYFTSDKLNRRIVAVYEQLMDVAEHQMPTRGVAPFV
ncbi:MAG: glycosyltransferase [Sporolactobacillus sp.]